MNTKNISFVLAFLTSVVLLVGVASATFASDVSIVNSSALQINISHGQSQAISFFLSNANSAGTNYTVKETKVVSSSPLTASPSAFSSILLNWGANSSMSSTVTVPLYTAPGNYNVIIEAVNDTTVSKTFTVNVPSSPSFTITRTTDIVSRGNNGTLSLVNTGNRELTLSLTSSGAFNALFYDSNNNQVTSVPLPISTTPVTLKVVPTNLPSTFAFGDNVMTVTATSPLVQNSVPFKIHEGFCKPVKGTNLSLSNIDVSNDGDGDDTEWFLLDDLMVKVDVDNIGPTDLDDVYVVFGLFDSAGTNLVKKLTFSNEDEDKVRAGNIDSGDDKRVTYEFKVPGDIKTGSYTMVFKAYSKDAGESNLCVDSSTQQVSINNQDDEGEFIGFDDIVLSQNEATCGETVSLDFETVNVGENDEDQVKVLLYNQELGINQFVEIKQGLDIGDSHATSFSFEIPSGMAEKYYNLELSSEYDYDNGEYREFSDGTELVPIKVFGCGASSSSSSLSASVQSDAKPGEDLIVAVSVTNTGSSSATYTIDARAYSDWARLVSISGTPVTIPAGETRTLQITLLPNSDASGDQSFVVQASSGSNIQTKTVPVSFSGSSSSFWQSISQNKLAWIVGLVNLVLIILIIIVAVKLSRN